MKIKYLLLALALGGLLGLATGCNKESSTTTTDTTTTTTTNSTSTTAPDTNTVPAAPK